MKELFLQHQRLPSIAKLYLSVQFLQALYFAWPVWYGFASEALSPVQIGLYFSVLAIVKVVAEIPTGAFADKYGRKLSAVIGAAIVIAVPLVVYYGHNFESYLVCAALLGIGGAFMSGSLDAMVYDTPGISKETYRHINWLEITFFQVGLIASTAIGGFMYMMHPSIPFIAEATACLLSFALILCMPAPKTRQAAASTHPEKYIGYFRTGLRHLLASTYLRVTVLAGVLVAVIVTASLEYVNEATMISYGIAPEHRGLLIAAAKIPALIIINLILLKLLGTDRRKMLFVAGLGTVIFSLLSIDSILVFLAGFLLFNLLSATQYNFFRPMLHDELPSSHRATAMSGYSALTGLAAFGANALFGFLIQFFRTPRSVYIVAVGVFVMVVVPCILWLASHLHRKTPATPLLETEPVHL